MSLYEHLIEKDNLNLLLYGMMFRQRSQGLICYLLFLFIATFIYNLFLIRLVRLAESRFEGSDS